MLNIERPTYAVELEFGLETADGCQINYLNNKIASRVVIDLARSTKQINLFPTLKPEFDANQLELTTNGFRFNCEDVADEISEFYYCLKIFIEKTVSEWAETQIILCTGAMPSESNFEPVTSLASPHYEQIDSQLRSYNLDIRRGTNVRGVHVHMGTFNKCDGVTYLNNLTHAYPDFLAQIPGLYTPSRIDTIRSVVNALGESPEHKTCDNPLKYMPGHSFMRYTKFGTLEFRHFDLGQKQQQSPDDIYKKVCKMMSKVIELV